jgi:site-specific DNA-cytosine methylase
MTLDKNSELLCFSTFSGIGGFEKAIQMEDYIVRKLTPIECERLQCFPDNWTESISNSQRYKCIGNAVNVEVVKHILTEMLKNKPPTFHLKESFLF